MESEVTVYDYATPLHRVLVEPNVILGIGVVPVALILILTIILMTAVSIWAGLIGVALYLISKKLCKKDPHMLEILFSRMAVPETWEAS